MFINQAESCEDAMYRRIPGITTIDRRIDEIRRREEELTAKIVRAGEGKYCDPYKFIV